MMRKIAIALAAAAIATAGSTLSASAMKGGGGGGARAGGGGAAHVSSGYKGPSPGRAYGMGSRAYGFHGRGFEHRSYYRRPYPPDYPRPYRDGHCKAYT